MNAKILLAGEYTDKVIVKSNFINGDNCTIANDIKYSHAEGQSSSLSSDYSHVDGVSSSIGTNSERGHIIGNKSKIETSTDSIIIGNNSHIKNSKNSIIFGYASIDSSETNNTVENNIVIGSNVKVDKGSNNVILASYNSVTSVSPNAGNSIYLYTPNGMDDIYINNNKLSRLTNTFGMRDVYMTLQDNDGISFVIPEGDSEKYTTVRAVSPYPVFDFHEARKILVKDYSESELANNDSPLYSASIGYVDRKFDGVGINGASLSLSGDITPADYFIVSFDRTAGSGIYATVNASIVDNSSEYHYNFGFELHYANDSVGISSDTYILNTNNIKLFTDTLSVVYNSDGSIINVYIRVLSNTNVKNIGLNITVKHTVKSNATFKKLEKLKDAISGTPVRFKKSILQSKGNKFEVDFTSSERVKAKPVSLSDSISAEYKYDVVTCGLLKEVRDTVVTKSGAQIITGTKRFIGNCYVKDVDINTNSKSDLAVNCESLVQYLASLGLNSGSVYVTLSGEQTITGTKTFTENVTFNKDIYGGGSKNGISIVNTSPNYGLYLYGYDSDNNGARLILDGKGAGSTGSKGSWSIKAGNGKTNNKALFGTSDKLTWGGERVLTETTDLKPVKEAIENINGFNSNVVTLTGAQTITGKKDFTGAVVFSGEVTFNNFIYCHKYGLSIKNPSTNHGICLYGGLDIKNGATLILDPKGATSGGAWSIRAGNGAEGKVLYGTTTELKWGGERVITYESDIAPMINSTLEANV